MNHPAPQALATIDAPIGIALLAGLIVSVVVMLAGLGLSAVHGTRTLHVLPLEQVPAHLARLDPPAVLDLGILLLFATPLVGVVVALIGFLRARDRFAVVSGVLLLILVSGFVVALHH